MLLISHRGNISGRNPERESSPEYIDEAIALGYTVEIDLFGNGELWLSHNWLLEKQYKITESFLKERSACLLIHCKNLSAAITCKKVGVLNYFYHVEEKYTVSSWGWIISHSKLGAKKDTICMLPEIHGLSKDAVKDCAGVCSDIISFYK